MSGIAKTDSGVSVVLVEDIRLLSDGIVAQLRRRSVRVVGTARTANEAIPLVRQRRPQVVLIDSATAGRAGPELTAEIVRSVAGTAVVVMDLLPREADVVAHIRAGAAGFVLRDAGIAQLVSALRAVTAGGRVLPPALAAVLFSHVASGGARAATGAAPADRLTPRERQVCDLVAEGLTNKEIGVRLHIARHTVKSHVHNVLEKLALRSRVQVARVARDLGGFARRRRGRATADLDRVGEAVRVTRRARAARKR